MRRRALLALAVLALAGCSTPEPRAPTPPSSTLPPDEDAPAAIALDLVADGFAQPVLVVQIEGIGLAVVEQAGRLVRLEDRASLLDITARVGSGGERGFLGFAPHPEDARVAIASYTDLAGDSVLSRFTRAGDGYDPDTEEVLVQVDQPFGNHNGGHVVFGPDGRLYWGLGDGGSAGDPQGNAQDKDALLGSMLRLEVGTEGPARAPADNPYVDGEGADEVWAKGLRNPWRFSFDRETGDLWIADVGQNREEEVNFQPAASRGGENYGWNVWEGNHRFNPAGRTFQEPVAPVATYPRGDGCAVTGGFVYRGSAIPALVGTYLFSDYCNGILHGVRPADGGWRTTRLLDTAHRVTSFGEDAEGELYVVDHGGAVLRIVAG